MKKELIIYWALSSLPNLTTRQNLIMEPPVSLRKELTNRIDKNKDTGYEACKSMHLLFKNSYVIKHPFSIEWDANDLEPKPIFIDRSEESNFINSRLIDYDHRWYFFSEESVELEMTPAYLHKKESDKYGYLAAGSYDISKWFRSLNATFYLWENENKLAFKKDDAIAYFHFKTDRKVVLKQFELTEKIEEIGYGTTRLKNIIPNLPLNDLYNRFTRSNRHIALLKEIKSNLLD
jgi:hypothetical protein